jgi:hypothetical protein
MEEEEEDEDEEEKEEEEDYIKLVVNRSFRGHGAFLEQLNKFRCA